MASPESSLQFQVNHKQVCAGMRQIPRLSLACILRPNRRKRIGRPPHLHMAIELWQEAPTNRTDSAKGPVQRIGFILRAEWP